LDEIKIVKYIIVENIRATGNVKKIRGGMPPKSGPKMEESRIIIQKRRYLPIDSL